MFKKAQREQVKLKLAITGPSGSGKTTGALRLAKGLTNNGKVALIDTENRSASLYADLFEFDVLDLEPPYDNRKFIDAIEAAVAGGYNAVIIDSASHFWKEILAFKDRLDKRGGNSYTNWAEAGNKFDGIITAVLQSPIHMICCLRSKMDYVLEQNDKGKQVPKKVGMAPIMRDGVEYEFTVVLDLDMAHQATSSKDRTRLFDGRVSEITEKTGEALRDWLMTGAAPTNVTPRPQTPPSDDIPMDESEALASPGQCDELWALWKELEKTKDDLQNALRWVGQPDIKGFDDLTRPNADRLLVVLRKQLAAANAQQPKNDTVNSDPLIEWLASHEDKVNGYLVRVKWVKAGQTWRDLPEERIEAVRKKQASFARNAEIEMEVAA